MVFESYGVAKHDASFNESMAYLLKLNKYRPPKSNETNLGIRIHTDKNFVTILSQCQINGLEVQIKDDEWISVDFSPSSLIIMANDAFMAWSNGRIVSPRHRVVMNGQEDRYSITSFSFKKGIIEIPEELVDEEHPQKFKSFDHFKFLEFYAKDPQYLDERIIKSFCGI
ncbi:hypothetical protein QVD17_28026 [Tagetes erecta]|uniref:Fe2OG dioxygenase domain-containing protein n=1 Tax=Tagetes erecta TaxID=13708 RepID=A0AAD8NRW8_TARER|nr:hypothetical protein QVD17_28026 [Tagetes erecta]